MNLAVFSQRTDPGKIIGKVADYILTHNAYGFVDTKTGQVYSNAKQLESPENIDFLSHFNGWKYSHGVLNMAMLDL